MTTMTSEPEITHNFQGLPSRCILCGEHEEGLLIDQYECPGPGKPRIQLYVTMMDGSIRFYSVPPGKGWKIDATSRCLIVGKGLGRIYIPLDNVESFSPIKY